MDIVILADFCGHFVKNNINNRFSYLAGLLSGEHEVEIVTSDFDHGAKQYFKKMPDSFKFKVTMLHENRYSKNISIKRLASHKGWGKEVKKYLYSRRKPDVIYAAMPTLYAAVAAAEYCEKKDVRFIVDVQDQWPEAFMMALNIPVVSDILFYPMKIMANKAYSRADEIVAVSQTYVKRALTVNKKCSAGHTVFLGTNLATFDSYVAECQPAVKKETQDPLWLGYCGSLSASYDIPCVIRALKMLKDKGSEAPKLIIMGDGARKQEFADLAAELSVDTVFTGKLPYNIMCATLKQCDIVVNPIAKGSAASIINKHGDYAASGLPVLNTQESVEYRNLVDEYRMGFNCKNGDAADLAEKLEHLIAHKEERIQMGQNSRRCAEERFDRAYSYKTLVECITK